MPRIAEIKEIDGGLWVKLDIERDPSGIGIYTPEEIDAIRKDEGYACAGLMDDQRACLERAEIGKAKGAGVPYNPEQTLWKKAAALIRAQYL